MNKKVGADLMKFEITDTNILMSIELKDLKKLFEGSPLIYNEEGKSAKIKKDKLYEFGCKFVEYLMDVVDSDADCPRWGNGWDEIFEEMYVDNQDFIKYPKETD